MKIREVCKLTGLTERTVRFWAAQGLIRPETYEMNGRSYFVFSREDVDELREIDTLRRAGFSLAQVQEMRAEPSGTGAAVQALLAELGRKQEETEQALSALRDAADCPDPRTLAARLREYAARRALPGASPHFGRFGEETSQEKSRAYEAFLRSSARRSRRKQYLSALAAALVLVLLSVLGTLGFSGQLQRRAGNVEPGWESRLSGSYDPAVDGSIPGYTPLEGLDGATGRMTRVYSLPAGEAVLSWHRLSPAEQELLEALEGGTPALRWQAEAALGPGAALCYLPAGDGGLYVLHALCDSRESLLAMLPLLQLRVEGEAVGFSSGAGNG